MTQRTSDTLIVPEGAMLGPRGEVMSGATAAQVIAAWINWRRSAALKAEFAPPAEIEPSRAADSGEPAD